MAYEVKNWKSPNCSLSFDISKLSDREIFSSEINETRGEGGALNANYRTVEAIIRVVDFLRGTGLLYGENYIFKTSGLDTIDFDFGDQSIKTFTREKLREFLA